MNKLSSDHEPLLCCLDVASNLGPEKRIWDFEIGNWSNFPGHIVKGIRTDDDLPATNQIDNPLAEFTDFILLSPDLSILLHTIG